MGFRIFHVKCKRCATDSCLSLLFGLFQQMGKSEQNPHRFRRKAKSSNSPSASRETTSDPAVSAPNQVGDLLCDSPAEIPSRAQGGGAHPELTNGEAEGGERRLDEEDKEDEEDEEDGLDQEDEEDGPAPTGDSHPASSLPADLAGLPSSDVTPLGSDGCLDLSACHVQGDDSVALVVFVHNSSSSDVQQVQLELHSDELQVIYFYFYRL